MMDASSRLAAAQYGKALLFRSVYQRIWERLCLDPLIWRHSLLYLDRKGRAFPHWCGGKAALSKSTIWVVIALRLVRGDVGLVLQRQTNIVESLHQAIAREVIYLKT